MCVCLCQGVFELCVVVYVCVDVLMCVFVSGGVCVVCVFLCQLLSVSDLFSALMGSDSPAQEMMCRKQPPAPYDIMLAEQPVCVLACVCVTYISSSNQSGVMLRVTVTNLFLALSFAHTQSLSEVKGVARWKMKLQSFTHFHVMPNLFDLFLSRTQKINS